MKVLNLRCSSDHRFEGWFASEDDFVSQRERSLVQCPLCGDAQIGKLPAAPRLNLGTAPEVAMSPADASPPGAAAQGGDTQTVAAHAGGHLQAAWMRMVREVLEKTEDVGRRFPEEARRMHYGEIEQRGIRGQASHEERQALAEEGIEVMPLPIPKGLDGPGH